MINFFKEYGRINEHTRLGTQKTISWSKPLNKLAKHDKVCSNERRWSDDSTSYSSSRGGSIISGALFFVLGKGLTGFEMESL